MTEKRKRTREEGKETAPAFEEALARLEEIADRLEGGELALEEAIALAEEGLKLSQRCEQQLKDAEGKIEQLVARMGGADVEPLEPDEGQMED